MRVLATAAVCAAAITVPAAASNIDPQALVVRQADLQAGFVVDRELSRATTNESYVRNGLGRLVARTGRLTGYHRGFRHRTSKVKVVQAGVGVFRVPDGAQAMLSWQDAEQRRHNAKRGVIQAYGRESVCIGTRGWVYWGGYPAYYVLVSWSSGSLHGYVVSWEIGRKATLALARLQQRRMAAALR